MIVDLAKFMTVLFLFLVGFSFLITAMNTPFFDTTEVYYLIFMYFSHSVLYITISKDLMSSKLNWLRVSHRVALTSVFRIKQSIFGCFS